MIGYLASTNFAITLASLAALSAREGLLWNGVATGTNVDDLMVQIGLGSSQPTTADLQGCYIYFAGSADGTNYSEPATGTDAAITLGTNSLAPLFVAVPVGTKIVDHCIGSVAQLFGGTLPKKVAIIIENRTNGALIGTEASFIKWVTPVFYTT